MVKFMFLGPFGPLIPEEDEQGYWYVEGEGKTVEEVLNTTKVADSKMGYSVVVNDKKVDSEYVLKTDDDVSVFPLFFAG